MKTTWVIMQIRFAVKAEVKKFNIKFTNNLKITQFQERRRLVDNFETP